MFTGDRSGEWLYAALHRAGLANQATWERPDDGLRLRDAYITSVVKCAPPANKPTTGERDNCLPYLERELELIDRARVVVALGKFGWDGFLTAARQVGVPTPRPKPQFGHGAEAVLDERLTLLGCFHPSQQNTFTGKLTVPMIDAVFARAVELAEAPTRPSTPALTLLGSPAPTIRRTFTFAGTISSFMGLSRNDLGGGRRGMRVGGVRMAMRRPRIKRTTESFRAPDGDYYLRRPSANRDVRIESPDERELRLLDALDGEHTLEQLHEEFGAEMVDDTIAQMQELEVIEDATDDDLVDPAELARFDRQLRYFSDIGTGGLTPSECQRRLREAKVAVLGVGGLGGWAAWSLATCGIGEMWLIDGDRVEISNLNRQILYTPADIGLLKVEAAAARLRAFNPDARITTTARRLGSDGRDRRLHRRCRRRHRRDRLARLRSRAVGERGLLRTRHPLPDDEPLPAGRPGRPALRPRRDRLLRLPEHRLAARLPAARRGDRGLAGEAEPGGDDRPGLRADRRPGGDGGDAPADRAERRPRPRASPTSTTCGRWRSNATR